MTRNTFPIRDLKTGTVITVRARAIVCYGDELGRYVDYDKDYVTWFRSVEKVLPPKHPTGEDWRDRSLYRVPCDPFPAIFSGWAEVCTGTKTPGWMTKAQYEYDVEPTRFHTSNRVTLATYIPLGHDYYPDRLLVRPEDIDIVTQAFVTIVDIHDSCWPLAVHLTYETATEWARNYQNETGTPTDVLDIPFNPDPEDLV